MSNPFEDELKARGAAANNPFETELQRRQEEAAAPPETPADTFGEAGEFLVRGTNKGLFSVLTMPYEGVRYLLDQGISIPGIGRASPGIQLPAAKDMDLYKPFLQQPEPKTDAGRYAEAVGEVIGSSVVPSGTLLAKAPQMARMAPTSLPAATARTVAEPIAARPGAAVAADVVGSVGAGIGQQAAEDMGFGPTGQAVAGIAGGLTPFAVAAPFVNARQAIGKARSTRDPHAKVAAALGEDQSIDDLAHSAAVGHTQLDPQNAYAQRVIDTLGQEMVRADGNRPAALAATLARLQSEGGVSASTAREQLRRVVNAQQGNDLMLGEYPAVMASNEATRQRTPGVIMRELDAANNMPNPDAAGRHRVQYDPGRVEDVGTHWMLDTVANDGTGVSSATVRNAVENRVGALAQRMAETIRGWAPYGADTTDVHAALERMRQAGNQAYRRVYDNAGAINYNLLHPMLQRVVERHQRRLAGFSGDQADELGTAINRLYLERPAGVVAREALPDLQDEVAALRMAMREARRRGAGKDVVDDLARRADQAAEQMRLTRRDATPPTQRYLMPTLEQLQHMRSAIRRQMDDPQRPDLQVVLGPLYRDITRVMERASPAWRVANRQWADLRLDRVAAELGESISLQAGPRFREQMRQFQQLAPEAQDFVRVEVAQKFADKLANMGDGENLAKLFKTPHIRHLVRTMFGDEAAVAMHRIARDNKIAAKTKGMMGGSPTQPRLARQQAMNADLELLGDVDNIPTSVGGFLAAIKKYTIGRAKEKRNREIAGIVTTPMRNTAQIAEHIERMRQAQALAERYRRPIARPLPVGSQIGNLLSQYGDE